MTSLAWSLRRVEAGMRDLGVNPRTNSGGHFERKMSDVLGFEEFASKELLWTKIPGSFWEKMDRVPVKMLYMPHGPP